MHERVFLQGILPKYMVPSAVVECVEKGIIKTATALP
jgi:hypothetical protein